MTEEIKEILDDYKKLAGEITEKLDNTVEYESWLIIQDYVDEFLNYITNLQKQLEKKDAYIKYLEEYNPKYYKGKKFYGDGREDYKQRNEKAIEFVKSMEYCGQEDYFYDLKSKDPCGNDNTFNDSKYKLLNILKGGDEQMNEEKIQFKISDCPKLKEDIEKMQNSYQQEMNKLHQELDQYKNNWEELKKWLEDDLKEVYRDAGYRHRLILEVLDKMKELEEDK